MKTDERLQKIAYRERRGHKKLARHHRIALMDDLVDSGIFPAGQTFPNDFGQWLQTGGELPKSLTRMLAANFDEDT